MGLLFWVPALAFKGTPEKMTFALFGLSREANAIEREPSNFPLRQPIDPLLVSSVWISVADTMRFNKDVEQILDHCHLSMSSSLDHLFFHAQCFNAVRHKHVRRQTTRHSRVKRAHHDLGPLLGDPILISRCGIANFADAAVRQYQIVMKELMNPLYLTFPALERLPFPRNTAYKKGIDTMYSMIEGALHPFLFSLCT